MRRAGWVSLVVCLTTSLVMGPFGPALASGPPSAGGPRVDPLFLRQLDRLEPSDPLAAIVHVQPGDDSGAQRFTDLGLEVHDTFESVGALYVGGSAAGFRALMRDPSVRYLEANREIAFHDDTDGYATRTRVASERVIGGPYFDPNGAPLTGAGQGVVVVDSGVFGAHPDLAERMQGNWKIVCSTPGVKDETTGRCFGPHEIASVDNSDSTSGHGTHVAGIVAGDGSQSNGFYRGAAPGAALYGMGIGEATRIVSIAEAFEFILDNRGDRSLFPTPIVAINNSWGDSDSEEPIAYDPDSVIAKLTRALVEAGITVVYSAGNEGGSGSIDRTSSTCDDPTPGVVCVANYDDLDTGARTNEVDTSSSRGQKGQPETYPDVSAPGTFIASSCAPHLPLCGSGATVAYSPWYSTMTGTSMAAPHVAGAVALLKQASPDLAPAEIEDLVQDTAFPFGFGYEPDPQNPAEPDDPATSEDESEPQGRTMWARGAGLLDVKAALDSLDTPHDEAPEPGDLQQIATDPVDGDMPFGAQDLTSLSVQETERGLRYFVGVRGPDFPLLHEVAYVLTQNIGGRAFSTRVLLKANREVRADDNRSTAQATETAFNPDSNTVSFMIPFDDLGDPPPGSPGHNAFVQAIHSPPAVTGNGIDAAPARNGFARTDAVPGEGTLGTPVKIGREGRGSRDLADPQPAYGSPFTITRALSNVPIPPDPGTNPDPGQTHPVAVKVVSAPRFGEIEATADVDGSPGDELLMNGREGGFYLANADGSVLWTRAWAGQANAAFVDDFDGDGAPDVVAQIINNEVARDVSELNVLSGRSGDVIWRTPLAGAFARPLAADLNRDGHQDIVTPNLVSDSRAEVAAFLGPDFSEGWREEIPGPMAVAAEMPNQIDVGQLDGDPALEVAFGSRDSITRADRTGKVTVIDGATGQTQWSTEDEGPVLGVKIANERVVAYLWEDFGVQDAAHGSDARLVAYSGTDGSREWTVPLLQKFETGAPMVAADLDGDGATEVVVASSRGNWVAAQNAWYASVVHAVTANGQVRWARAIPHLPRFLAPAPRAGGGFDIAYGLVGLPGASQAVPLEVGLMSGSTGAPVWTRQHRKNISGVGTELGSVAVADVDGDNAPEFLYSWPAQRVTALTLNEGQPLFTRSYPTGPWITGDAADIDQDGTLETIVGGNDGLVRAFEEDGTLSWVTPVGGGTIGGLRIQGDRVLGSVLGEGAGAFSLDVSSGEPVWDTPTGIDATLRGVRPQQAFGDLNGDDMEDIVVVGSVLRRPIAAAFDGATGAELWRVTPAEGEGVVQSVVTLGDRVLLSHHVTAAPATLTLLDSHGVPLWSVAAGRRYVGGSTVGHEFISAIRLGGNILVGLDDVLITALRIDDGSEAWRHLLAAQGDFVRIGDRVVTVAKLGVEVYGENGPTQQIAFPGNMEADTGALAPAGLVVAAAQGVFVFDPEAVVAGTLRISDEFHGPPTHGPREIPGSSEIISAETSRGSFLVGLPGWGSIYSEWFSTQRASWRIDPTPAAPEKIPTTTSLVVEGKGSKRTLVATLAEESGPVLSGQEIVFFADGNEIGRATTNSDGVAVLKVPPAYRGTGFTFKASFEGNHVYLESTS